MASFLAKMGRERPRKSEKKKIIVPTTSYLTRNRKLKEIAKKFKKIKNIIMASCQAKMGGEWLRQREKKLSFRSIPTRPGIENWKKKNSKKIQKIKKHHYGFLSSQNKLGKAEKVWKEKLSFRSFPTQPLIENWKKKRQKNSKN